MRVKDGIYLLDSSNYDKWEIFTTSRLQSEGHWYAVTTKLDMEVKDTDAATTRKLKEERYASDRAAFDSIVKSIHPDIVVGSVDLTLSAKDLWEQLREAHIAALTANIGLARQQLRGLTLGKNESMQTYFLRAQKLFDTMAAADTPYSDADKQSVLLSGLPPAYNAAVEYLQNGVFKTHVLLPKLQTTELRLLAQQKLRTDPLPDALGFSATAPGPSSRSFSPRVCFNCNRPGHISPKCTQPVVQCKLCRRMGHMDQHCDTVAKKRHAFAAMADVLQELAFDDANDPIDQESADILFHGLTDE